MVKVNVNVAVKKPVSSKQMAGKSNAKLSLPKDMKQASKPVEPKKLATVAKTTMPAKLAPKTSQATKKVQVVPKKLAKPQGKGPKVVRDPTKNGTVWRSVLRLTVPMADKLKKAAKRNDMSVNAFVSTIIEVYLKEAA